MQKCNNVKYNKKFTNYDTIITPLSVYLYLKSIIFKGFASIIKIVKQ